ncbi:MAG: iron-sulfur cluster carrier protein ApbC [Legionellales bacterium]|nr:iron-sulfur cluster carrier protein ApbC [Legionellales bacterium]|tara:strand:- start:45737 stop:46813 length:1077 start_codon:yes stop_codon:yes gene_type:complete
MDQNDIQNTIQSYLEPTLGADLVTAKAVKTITIQGDRVDIHITLGFPHHDCEAAIRAALSELLTAKYPQAQFTIVIDSDIVSHAVQQGLQSIPNVKNIIAVASGKGGVGKSTTAVNLALALAQQGARVGILDADIYGPSQPQMLGTYDKPKAAEAKQIEPIERHGIQAMSIGFLVDQKTAMVWRGPMVTGALQQLLSDTCWHDLDYLFIDLPPGTGDIQLTMAQKIPVSGAVIVTTPQDLALLDARRAINMFAKVRIPVLGVVENMSTHICSNCGHEEGIFGQGGGASLADEFDCPLLGQLPLALSIREQADGGKPTVAAEPESPIAQTYRQIALKVAAQLSKSSKNYSGKFPKIVIE